MNIKENLNIAIALVGIGLSLVLGQRIPSFAGPFRVKVRTATATEEHTNSSHGIVTGKGYVTQFRHRQPQYVWGYSHNTIEINDEQKIDLRISAWTSNGWKPNAFVMKFDRACSTGVNHVRPLMQLAFPVNGKAACPVPPAYRQIHNQSLDLHFQHFPVFPYGRWLVQLYLINGWDLIGLLEADVETVPYMTKL